MAIEEIGPELRAHIARKYKTSKAAASAWGVSTAFVSAVVNGTKRPTQTMLDDAGFERVESQTVYKKKKGAKA